MANIMLTDVCNLNCPYCFANEFVNRDTNEISENNFDKAVDFILGDGSHSSVGLIGGEPTVHSNFDNLLRKLIRDKRANTIVIYTNGIIIDRFWDIISHNKIRLLVNCNSPQAIGDNNYARLCKNLDTLILDKEFKDNVTLGINMYNSNFEYGYILDLLNKYDYHHVRVSITVPNIEEDRNVDAHAYFEKMKPRMFEFFHELLNHEIIPNFDCNKIPHCCINSEELEQFRKYYDIPFIRDNIGKSNISNTIVHCVPVIDIRQDLTAVRCFGLSGYTKQNIENFSCIKDLENYYIRTIDAYAYNTAYSAKCNDCYDRKVLKCMGGCLAFKINEILAAQRYVEDRLVKGE